MFSKLSRLQDLALQNKLPHAWLLLGNDYAGKIKLAVDFAKWLLCDFENIKNGKKIKNNYEAMFRANTHPDYYSLEQLTTDDKLNIDNIRIINDFVYSKSQYGDYKVVLINNLETINQQSANAMLKFLEEPPAGVVFLLLAKNIYTLSATIVSRCQQLLINNIDANINAINNKIFMDFENIINNKLYAIVAMEGWLKQDKFTQKQLLNQLWLIIVDCIKKYSNRNTRYRNRDNSNIVNNLWAAYQELNTINYNLVKSPQLNLQLALEGVLLKICS